MAQVGGFDQSSWQQVKIGRPDASQGADVVPEANWSLAKPNAPVENKAPKADGDNVSKNIGNNQRQANFSPVIHFVQPQAQGDDHKQGGAENRGQFIYDDALMPRANESTESRLNRAMGALRMAMGSPTMTDAQKGSFLARAIDTISGLATPLNADAQAMIAKATTERNRLQALMAATNGH